MSLSENILAELNAAMKRDATLRKLGIVKIQDYVADQKKWYFHRPSELRQYELDDLVTRRDQSIEEADEAIRDSRRRIAEAKSHFNRYRHDQIRTINQRSEETAQTWHRWKVSIELNLELLREQATLYSYLYKEHQWIKRAKKVNCTFSKLRFRFFERHERQVIRTERERERQKREQHSYQLLRFDEYAKHKGR